MGTQAVIELLADLDAHGFLGRFHLDDLVSWERLNEALREAQAAEKELAIMEDPVPQGHAHSHERHRYSAATPKSRLPYGSGPLISMTSQNRRSKACGMVVRGR